MKFNIDTSSLTKKDNINTFVQNKNDTNSEIEKLDLTGTNNDNVIERMTDIITGEKSPLASFEKVLTIIRDNALEYIRKGREREMSQKLEELGKWYMENVPTYGTNTYNNPFVSYGARADCSGFAAVYMSHVAGIEIPTSSSYQMIDPNGDWAAKAREAGWVAYTSDEIDTLRTGDVLVANSGMFYSNYGNHAEVYIDEEHTFGWGHVWNQYPRVNPVKTLTEGDGHVHFKDYKANGQCSHDYITVYRYEPDTKAVENKEKDLSK